MRLTVIHDSLTRQGMTKQKGEEMWWDDCDVVLVWFRSCLHLHSRPDRGPRTSSFGMCLCLCLCLTACACACAYCMSGLVLGNVMYCRSSYWTVLYCTVLYCATYYYCNTVCTRVLQITTCHVTSHDEPLLHTVRLLKHTYDSLKPTCHIQRHDEQSLPLYFIKYIYSCIYSTAQRIRLPSCKHFSTRRACASSRRLHTSPYSLASNNIYAARPTQYTVQYTMHKRIMILKGTCSPSTTPRRPCCLS